MNTYSKILLLSSVAAMTFAAPAFAGDLGDTWSKERFQVRVRALDVIADGDGKVTQNGLKTEVDHAITPEVDVTYFFTDNVAAELIAATSEHDIDAGPFDVGSA